MARWRVIDTGANDGAYNMAADQVLAQGLAKSPVLRFYDWDPPAVSCGYGQRSEREVDSAVCSALGIDIVRRPTGGRAVLHWEELTYSVVCDPREHLLEQWLVDGTQLVSDMPDDAVRKCQRSLQRNYLSDPRPAH